jgi:hypothetical protein
MNVGVAVVSVQKCAFDGDVWCANGCANDEVWPGKWLANAIQRNVLSTSDPAIQLTKILTDTTAVLAGAGTMEDSNSKQCTSKYSQVAQLDVGC